MKISQLPKVNDLNGLSLVGSSEAGSVRLEMPDVVKAVKNAIGLYDRVLEKCSFCGQWGAVMCECPKCGAPIDPKEEYVLLDPAPVINNPYHVAPTQYPYHVPRT